MHRPPCASVLLPVHRNGSADVDRSSVRTVVGPGDRHADADGSDAAGRDQHQSDGGGQEQCLWLEASHGRSPSSQNEYCCRTTPAPVGSRTTATVPLRRSLRGSTTTVPPSCFVFSTRSAGSETRT